MVAAISLVLLSAPVAEGPSDSDSWQQVEACVAAVLNKPVRQSVLLDAILAALARRSPGPEPPSPAAHPPPPEAQIPPSVPPRRSLRVLVAEDNPVNPLVIRRLLERLHHTVVVCKNGRDAVAAVEAERPDLVLMDIQMPEMDGFAATAAIRERESARPGHGRLPIRRSPRSCCCDAPRLRLRPLALDAAGKRLRRDAARNRRRVRKTAGDSAEAAEEQVHVPSRGV